MLFLFLLWQWLLSLLWRPRLQVSLLLAGCLLDTSFFHLSLYLRSLHGGIKILLDSVYHTGQSVLAPITPTGIYRLTHHKFLLVHPLTNYENKWCSSPSSRFSWPSVSSVPRLLSPRTLTTLSKAQREPCVHLLVTEVNCHTRTRFLTNLHSPGFVLASIPRYVQQIIFGSLAHRYFRRIVLVLTPPSRLLSVSSRQHIIWCGHLHLPEQIYHSGNISIARDILVRPGIHHHLPYDTFMTETTLEYWSFSSNSLTIYSLHPITVTSTLWWTTADRWLKATSTPSSKSLIYKKEKETSSSLIMWHRYAKRTIGWLCPSSSRCKEVRGQLQRDRGRTLGTMCTCEEIERGKNACRASKLGPVERWWTQDGKLGIIIQDLPPESGRQTHLSYFTYSYCILSRVWKVATSAACFTSLWTSISVFHVNTARDVVTVLLTHAKYFSLYLQIFTCTYRGTHTQAHMYNQHTRGMAITRHRSLVESGGRKVLLETLHTQTKTKKCQGKTDINESKEKIRAHRASNKATRLFLTK